ncbi:MAG: chaperonin 10-like protein [Linnemannia elongata]|nr:MAG: chaperonin 10-like protein [Linnemannia elongata]
MTSSTMRAINITETGTASVTFAGVNFYDVIERTGRIPAQLPLTLGHEGSGTIVEVGSEVQHGFQVGDQVAFFSGGAYAEYAVVETINLAKLPDQISFETGAALYVQGLTAWGFVRNGYPVKKNDWVVVHAAAGGVGLLALQLAHHQGAHVIGVVSDKKAALARSNGADYTVVISSNDYAPLEGPSPLSPTARAFMQSTTVLAKLPSNPIYASSVVKELLSPMVFRVVPFPHGISSVWRPRTFV